MQKYDKNPEPEDIHAVTGYNLVKLNADKLKLMKRLGIAVGDVDHLEAYETYLNLLRLHRKKEFIYAFIRREYGISRSSMRLIVARFEGRASVCPCAPRGETVNYKGRMQGPEPAPDD